MNLQTIKQLINEAGVDNLKELKQKSTFIIEKSISIIKSEANAVLVKASKEIVEINGATKVAVEETVMKFLQPYLNKVVEDVTLSLAKKVDELFQQASEQLQISKAYFEEIKSKEMQLAESLKKTFHDFDRESQRQKASQNNLADVTNTLAKQVERYRSALEINGFKEGAETRIARFEKQIVVSEVVLGSIVSKIDESMAALKKLEDTNERAKAFSEDIKKKFQNKDKEFDMGLAKKELERLYEIITRTQKEYVEEYDRFKRLVQEHNDEVVKLESLKSAIIKDSAKLKIIGTDEQIRGGISQITSRIPTL